MPQTIFQHNLPTKHKYSAVIPGLEKALTSADFCFPTSGQEAGCMSNVSCWRVSEKRKSNRFLVRDRTLGKTRHVTSTSVQKPMQFFYSQEMILSRQKKIQLRLYNSTKIRRTKTSIYSLLITSTLIVMLCVVYLTHVSNLASQI